MFPAQMASAIVAQAQQAPGIVMPSGEREATRKRLTAQLLRLERQEETIIQAMHSQGQLVHRRMRADPMAVLGLAFADEPMAIAISSNRSGQTAEVV